MSNVKGPSIITLLKKYAFPLWRYLFLLMFFSLAGTIFTSIQPVMISGLMEITIGEKTSVSAEAPSKANGILSFFNLNQVGENVKKLVLT